MQERPFFSVIVPVFNGERTIRACLEALAGSSFVAWELIVVDDGSSDRSAELARDLVATVLQTPGRSGPAAARNLGARQARGEYLFFVDSDCAVHWNTLAEAADIFSREPGLDALFGSYDDAPAVKGIVALYKNLQHHHVHQAGTESARTFWAGCGAIRKEVFESLDGFDTHRYDRPSIEDIDLGYRLTRRGGRIRLAKAVLVKHYKEWSLPGVLRTDLMDRGIPWTRLLLEGGEAQGDLNLGWRGRGSVLLSVVGSLAALAALVWAPALALTVLAAVALLAINFDFYRLLGRRGGVRLLLAGVVLHWLYHLNCAIAYVVGHLSFWRRRGDAAARAE